MKETAKVDRYVDASTCIDHVNPHQIVLFQMLQLIKHKNSQISREALQYVGSVLTTENGSIIEFTVNNNVYEILLEQTYSCQSEVIKEALWALSNLTASGPACIQYFLSNELLFDRVLTLCENPNLNIKQEALYATCNSFTVASENEKFSLLSKTNYTRLITALRKGLSTKNMRLGCLQEIIQTLQLVIVFSLEQGEQIMEEFEAVLVLEAIADSNIFQQIEQIRNQT